MKEKGEIALAKDQASGLLIRGRNILMRTMAEIPSIFGRWRITWMEQWDHDFVDAEVEGFIRLDSDNDGEFQFGYVSGQLWWEPTERAGRPAAEWSWEGSDEMDPASGRGWAVLEEDGSIKGKITLHGGSSLFVAVRK